MATDLATDLEYQLIISCKCYEAAHDLLTSGVLKDLAQEQLGQVLKRLGNIRNEMGVFYMNQAAAMQTEKEGGKMWSWASNAKVINQNHKRIGDTGSPLPGLNLEQPFVKFFSSNLWRDAFTSQFLMFSSAEDRLRGRAGVVEEEFLVFREGHAEFPSDFRLREHSPAAV